MQKRGDVNTKLSVESSKADHPPSVAIHQGVLSDWKSGISSQIFLDRLTGFS
jgi:hypothetical protein